MRNWRNIGRVTVKDYRGRSLNFDTLDEAVRWVGKTHIEGLKYGRLGCSKLHPFSTNVFWTDGDSHVFLEELGLIIPVWRVQEAYRNLPNVWAGRPKWWRFRGFKRTTGHNYRRPRTQQERRERQGDGHRWLPSSRDDLHIAAREVRNWKRFRKTQWRSARKWEDA